jgi:hypothetical protein
MMPWPDRRRMWVNVRLEYYVSARSLMGQGFFHSAGILFGYTIETHLQAILYEFHKGDQDRKVGRKILKNHKIAELFNHCIELDLLQNVSVSNDFLMFIEDNFQRYPGQIIPSIGKRLNENGVSSYGRDDIHYYDNLVIQLDKNILEYTHSLDASIGVKAIMMADSYHRVKFFKNNVHALSNVDYYLNMIKSLDRDRYNGIIKYYEPPQFDKFCEEMTSGLPMGLTSIEDIMNSTKIQKFKLPKSEKFNN